MLHPRLRNCFSQRPRRSCGVVALIALFFLNSISRADTVAIQRPGDQNSVTYSDVKVTDIEHGIIVFTSSVGNTIKKDMSNVTQLSIDDEPQFNQAVQDYAANKFDQAVTEFDQTIQSTTKPWLKAYCEPLFTDAANKAGRFDKAVQGFIYLVLNTPDSAAAHRPAAPGSDSSYLDSTAQALSDAANTANLSNQQQAALLSLLLDVDRARNDTQAIDAVASKLKDLTGDTSASTDNTASIALADAKLTEASNAVNAQNYAQAISIITASQSLFVDPRRQADALYILAKAHDGQAQAKDDADAWRDAAIAYMRVVANFKDAPGSPHVADSLLATASILETHLNEGGKAMKIDQDIQSRFPDTRAANEAAKQLARLQAAGVQAD
jgi:hypothetical protein